MNSRIFLLFWAVLGLFSSPVMGSWQPVPTVTRDDQGFPRLNWLSLPGRTYFVQYSYDLETWTYTSEIFHEGFGVVGMTFDSGDDTIYLRLKYTDIPTYDAELANFDGAGATNQLELDAGSDPLVAEAGEPLVPGSTYRSPPPPPGIEGLGDDSEDDLPVYFIKMVETGGGNNGTRYYYLNRRYQLLPTIALPGGDTSEDSWPAQISRKPDGVKTKITFEIIPGFTPPSGETAPPIFAAHERPIDLLRYAKDEHPDDEYSEIRKVTDAGTLIIPRMGTTSETVTIPGDNKNGSWEISPFVVRGLEPDPDGASGDPLLYSRRAGTDIVSRRSLPAVFGQDGTLVEGDLGHKSNTWIMAPEGSGSTAVENEANPPFPIVLEGDFVTIAPSLISNVAGPNGEIPGVIRGQIIADPPGGAFGSEILKVRPEDDGIDDPNTPDALTATHVSVLTIPARTVTVNIYPIASITDGVDSNGNAIIVESPPNPLPSEEEIQDYFDRVYFEQSNVKCKIECHSVKAIRWDIAEGKVHPQDPNLTFPNTYINYFSPETEVSSKGDQILDFSLSDFEKDAIIAGRDLPENELHLFWIGGAEEGRHLENAAGSPTYLQEVSGRWVGFAEPGDRRCYVVGDLTEALGDGKPNPAIVKLVVNRLLNTMAHEIGHILVGSGHPDQNSGPAPLAADLVLQQRRLMVLGGAGVTDHELVTVEWVKIFIKADEIFNLNQGDE